tara:strand:- start:689 stop:1108 length:420 start_codon:yes stop_codon:yes gene_type:complete
MSLDQLKRERAQESSAAQLETLFDDKALQKKILLMSDKERNEFFEKQYKALEKIPLYSHQSHLRYGLSTYADKLRDLDLRTRRTIDKKGKVYPHSNKYQSIESLDEDIKRLRNEQQQTQLGFEGGGFIWNRGDYGRTYK